MTATECAGCGVGFRRNSDTQRYCSRRCALVLRNKTPKRRPLEERFWAKVRRGGPDECWEWVSKAKHWFGYGRIGSGGWFGPCRLAHRVSWEIHHGPVPDGLFVLHRCDNPPCVNPAHLFLGTIADNVADAQSKGRLRRRPGHQKGAKNGNAKLSEDDVREIRRLRRAGALCREIACRFGITGTQVSVIEKRKQWADVPDEVAQ